MMAQLLKSTPTPILRREQTQKQDLTFQLILAIKHTKVVTRLKLTIPKKFNY